MNKLALLCFVFLPSCFAQNPSQALLSHLEGSWRMSGSVRSKPVTYAAEGTWELKNQFLFFHMKDAAVPSTYEANLHIGVDSARNEFVAHWLDSFGGAGARVVGFGRLSGEKIEIVYTYPEGRFRNVFKYDSSKDQWTLLIESEDARGQWSVFAQYTIVKKR